MAQFDPFSPNLDYAFLNRSPNSVTRNSHTRFVSSGLPNHVAMSELSLRDRWRRLQSNDEERAELVDELLSQLDVYKSKIAQIQTFQSHQLDAASTIRDLEDQLKRIELMVNQDPYVTVLMDGTHFLHHSDLLKKGEGGGQLVANLLKKAMDVLIAEHVSDVECPKVNLKVFSDMKLLGGTIVKAWSDCHLQPVELFAKGFNGAQPLFSYIDAGPRKDSVKTKLSEHLQLDLYNCHCRHIFLAIPDGETYDDLFYELSCNRQACMRVTLLSNGTKPGGSVQKDLDLSTINFDSIECELFSREQPGTYDGNSQSTTIGTVLAQIMSLPNEAIRTPPASSSSTPSISCAGLMSQPVLAKPNPAFGGKSNPLATTHASSTIPKTAAGSGVVKRNRFGQRIDKQDTTIPFHEITRIKKMKLCNAFYLQGPAACTSSCCTHRHDYPISNFERRVLREVARTTPCYYKTDCDESECIYGHRCSQNKPGEASCFFGETCRFWNWGHGIDTEVVKITKV